MRYLFLLLLTFSCAFSQHTVLHSVYFDFDKDEIKDIELRKLIQFTKDIDRSKIMSVNIYGYCDDRGNKDYNYKLSERRADKVRKALEAHGINKRIFVNIEGKGKVALTDDKNKREQRTRNRRVDVDIQIDRDPQLFYWIQKHHVVNDRVFLLNIYFERGSDKLDHKSMIELRKLSYELNAYKELEFEVQGHVCCTPTYHFDAVNRYTKKRQLSHDRAKKVYEFLAKKGVSKKRMTHKGYGNTQPVPGAKDKFNRRVELLITKTELD